MRHVALIADLVKSRQSTDRSGLQRQLEQVLDNLNEQAPALGLVSPLTVTLGDEFQGVFQRAHSVWQTILTIEAALQPVSVRFAIGVGSIDTALKHDTAIGMDGPAFHRARHALEALKPTLHRYRIRGVGRHELLVNHALDLFCHQRNKWRENRLHILVGHLNAERVDAMAARLGISEQAVYRNISDGALETIAGVLDGTARVIDEALSNGHAIADTVQRHGPTAA